MKAPRESGVPDSAPSQRPSGMRPVSREWRCLELGQPESPRLARREDSRVSIAQLSVNGERLRHSGPAEWLPDTTEFLHRAALLVAQGLGFERCRGVCLQGERAVLAISDAGPSTVTGVTGPVEQLSNVLRQRGLK